MFYLSWSLVDFDGISEISFFENVGLKIADDKTCKISNT